MRLVSLSSGSSGNAIYVGTDNTHILIDVGISAKKIEEGLSSIDIGLEDLTAIVITHEHIDHIRSLGIMLRKRQIPIYATKGTLDAIDDMNNLGKMPDIDRHIVISENDIDIGDISLHPFKVDHDAKEPVAYRMTSDGKSIAVATDMGHYTDDTIRNLSGLDAALIESNHDIHMLEVGPYPFYLKRRILGDHGHLSNDDAGKLICKILHDNMKYIALGHLSKENNYPDLAYETVRCEIGGDDCKYKPNDFPIEVAKRDIISVNIEV